MPMLDPWPTSPYTLLVSRRVDGGHCQVWPVHLRERLPVLPVPLAYPEPDLTLDLQPLVDRILAVGRYAERIDYTRRLTPPLEEADAAWLRGQIGGRVTER